MITHDEIEEKAHTFEVQPSDVQRDYVLGWFLFGMFTQSPLRDRLFLKGGNALRKGYFAETRYSGDLDFGIPDDIDPDVLRTALNDICAFVERHSEIAFVPDRTKVEEKRFATQSVPGGDAGFKELQVFDASIYFKDFYGNPTKFVLRVSMDITRFDRVMLPIQQRELIHPYSDAESVKCTIRCMKLEEIVATKLKCLLQREHAPDLFDYVHTMRLMGATLNRA